jgi:acyl carrier protein
VHAPEPALRPAARRLRNGPRQRDRMTVRARIREFIIESFFVDDFSDDDSFLRNSIIDSLGMLELVAFLEKEFGIKVSDAELVPENLDTLAKVCAFVERKKVVGTAA